MSLTPVERATHPHPDNSDVLLNPVELVPWEWSTDVNYKHLKLRRPLKNFSRFFSLVTTPAFSNFFELNLSYFINITSRNNVNLFKTLIKINIKNVLNEGTIKKPKRKEICISPLLGFEPVTLDANPSPSSTYPTVISKFIISETTAYFCKPRNT